MPTGSGLCFVVVPHLPPDRKSLLPEILDIAIPGGMGGTEAAKQILNIDPGAILITSSGSYAESAFTVGTGAFFRGVVSKPYNVRKLSQELARLIKPR
jgi:DNA-binding NtrC family response regulator